MSIYCQPAMKEVTNLLFSCKTGMMCNLNPSMWEYQSAALDCIYHTARQNGTASGDILDING